MLDGFSYPLYKDLRALGYDFVRGVHNIEGINCWVRVVNAGEAQKAEKETAVALIDRGWKVSKSAPHSQHNAFSVGFSSTQIVVSNGTLRGAQRVPRASSKHPGSRQSVLIRARHVL